MLVDSIRLLLGAVIIIFHRPIADFILHQEEKASQFFRSRGVRLPDFPSPKVAHDVYFLIGVFVVGISLLRLLEVV